MSDVIYLDHCATTPVDPRVIEVMVNALQSDYGNPSSRHFKGYSANRLIKQARRYLAALLGASVQDLVFTSGATEAINLGLRGVLQDHDRDCHVVTSSAEHKAVLETLEDLEGRGRATVTYLDPRADGRISVDEVEAALRPTTCMVALMWANNETGVINPMEAIGELCRQQEVLFFSDATQAVGKVPVDVENVNIDLLALSGHKFYGPKGAGALFVRRRLQSRLAPTMAGGQQERALRAGTQNVPGIVGLGEAARLALDEVEQDIRHTAALRDRLEARLLEKLPAHVNGSREWRLPSCLNLSMDGIDAEALVSTLRHVCISTGSACTSGTHQPSHVLLAMGLSKSFASNAVRLSVGRFNTIDEVDLAVEEICESAERIRELSQ
jgi:cysteine desulfurase